MNMRPPRIEIGNSGHLEPSRLRENKSLEFQMPISPYKSDFLLWVKILILFLVVQGQMSA